MPPRGMNQFFIHLFHYVHKLQQSLMVSRSIEWIFREGFFANGSQMQHYECGKTDLKQVLPIKAKQ